MNVAAHITTYLMLGSAGAKSPEFLKKNNITLVINATNKSPPDECCVKQVFVNVDDSPKCSLRKHFQKIASLIYEEKEQGGNFFVHCIGGISRAPSLVIAYLMTFEKMTLKEAHSHVQEQRTFVRPNAGFWQQLIEYEKEVNGKNTVTMVTYGSELIPSIYKEQYENMII